MPKRSQTQAQMALVDNGQEEARLRGGIRNTIARLLRLSWAIQTRSGTPTDWQREIDRTVVALEDLKDVERR